MSRKLTEDERTLKDLAYEAYLSALRPDDVQTVLDKLQNAYWQGLEMQSLDEAMNGPAHEPPF